MDMVHRAGINHQAVDGESRPPTSGTDKTKLEDDIPVLTITTDMFNTGESKQEQEDWEK